ncbi:MAG: nuclear transport factor 2 family protein [Ilumatobacteraceae bacterium]|jgi:ketosteroid isomerase-like protein|nr:nuclear transport factor 2 family protein [Ilumatobacteraceae bacterium]
MPAPIATDDYVEIQRLIHRYADAVVHRDRDQWASCWAPEAVWDLGRGRLVEGREAIVDLWTAAMGGMAAVVQLVHNGEVVEGGDRDHAAGRWYIDERYLRADGVRGILLAHYDDTYVRHEGRWLFESRFLQTHYGGPGDLSADFLNTNAGLTERGLAPHV